MKAAVKLITVFMSALMILGLSGCMHSTAKYENADKYSSGDREFSEEITRVDIDWSSGKVTVSENDGNTVSVTETCSEELSDSKKVHTWLEGSVLHIRFSASGETFYGSTPEKKLSVKLPKGLKLDAFDYSGSSAEASFENITAGAVRADSSSGDLRFTSCTADSFKLDASSGGIELEQKGSTDSIKAETSSGKITISAEDAGEIVTETSSGDQNIKAAKANRFSAEASSGGVEARLGAMPSDLKIDTSSGDLELYLPKDADFKGTIETSSGEIKSELAMSNDGSSYACGAGTNSLSIKTSSGDISVKTEG